METEWKVRIETMGRHEKVVSCSFSKKNKHKRKKRSTLAGIELGTSGTESMHLKFGRKKTHMKKKRIFVIFKLGTPGAKSAHLKCFLLTTTAVLRLVCTSTTNEKKGASWRESNSGLLEPKACTWHLEEEKHTRKKKVSWRDSNSGLLGPRARTWNASYWPLLLYCDLYLQVPDKHVSGILYIWLTEVVCKESRTSFPTQY